jgi:hypothetical protein
MRAMRAKSPKPRHPRLPKEARVLKLIVAEARPDHLRLAPPPPLAAPALFLRAPVRFTQISVLARNRIPPELLTAVP